jgi:hypothetical protein
MNIDREFIKWFYEENYPEQGSNRRQCYGMTAGTTNIDTIDYWMREAFRAGAQAAQIPQYESDEGALTPEQIAMLNEMAKQLEIGTFEEQQAFDRKRNYPL